MPAIDRNATAQSRAAIGGQPSGPGYYTVKRGDTLYRIALENGQDYRDVAGWNNIVNPSSIKEGQVLRVAPPSAPESGGAVVANPVASGDVVESRSLDQPVAQATTTMPGNGSVKREPRVGKEPYSDEAYARLNKNGEQFALAPDSRVEAKPDPASTVPAATAGPDDVPWLWPSSGKVVASYSEAGSKGLDFSGRAGDPVIAAGDGKVVYAGAGLRGYGELVIVKHNATFLSAYAHNRKILVKEGQQVSRGQKIAEMGNTDADSVKLHFEIRKQGKPVDPAQYLPKR
ncbi:peptidoglycan DD-metalloendopeptidase family protein [Dechloromonas sp. A34]|uniref:peptidoglycan DD-metalloendopeptidase family protein n=1 Tax=Dechloromonas sp. A34 TaxID=447588 RepID=UPI002248B4CB|nr:peptidoglycan DD-metalloendopeptidase family protein [Dechloromonas sp. A34]